MRELAKLRRITVTFSEDGMEYAVRYSHPGEVPQPTPGSKGRTTRATRMARVGLERALEGLDKGNAAWGGFGTNTRESTDHVIVERREQRAS